MLLSGFSLEIFKSKCDSNAQGVHCFVHLDDNISEVLPYLNTNLGGFVYTEDPPSLTLKNYGKLLTLHPEKIADWLQREINETWDNRHKIEPSTTSARQPTLLEILKLLPKTNCRECHEPTCMVFASRVVEGVKDGNDCPPLSATNKEKLAAYLTAFNLE